MRIQYVLHADFERPGYIEHWARGRTFSQAYCRPFAGERLPAATAFDVLIVMGGPQSPLALEDAPYLSQEIDLISQALRRDVPVLGFCLGAQLLAETFGARTERSPSKEIGFFPIDLTQEGRGDPLLQGLPPRFTVAHWHNDMPGLTSDCEVLATSAGCPRQIVRYAPRAYGFQCHPEFTTDSVEMMVRNCAADLAPGTYVQSAEQMLSADLRELNARVAMLLDNFLSIRKWPVHRSTCNHSFRFP
jgi:GMP synthase (glutamine-hydrolysing)